MARFETIQVGDQPMRLCCEVPSAVGPRPGVLVMMHGPGLDGFIESRVDDLARHGYVAAAPDLFHRQPDDGSDSMTRVARLLDREILADADAAVAHMRRLGDASVGPLAVLGFCMGGRNTYLLAGARPDLWRAAAVFYGGNIMKPWGEGPSFTATTARATHSSTSRCPSSTAPRRPPTRGPRPWPSSPPSSADPEAGRSGRRRVLRNPRLVAAEHSSASTWARFRVCRGNARCRTSPR